VSTSYGLFSVLLAYCCFGRLVALMAELWIISKGLEEMINPSPVTTTEIVKHHTNKDDNNNDTKKN
jgi:hypothetical protein